MWSNCWNKFDVNRPSEDTIKPIVQKFQQRGSMENKRAGKYRYSGRLQ